MEKSGYGRDGIFRSLRPPLVLPEDEYASIVSFLFRNSSSYEHKLALADADSLERLNFREFKEKVNQVGSGLNQVGINKGDVVLVYAPNSIYFIICFYGIVSLGAVATTVNPLYTTMEVSKQVQDSKAKLIITVPQLWDKVKDVGLPAVIIGNNSNEYKGLTSKPPITFLSELLTMGSQKSPPVVNIKQTDTAALLYSSGTTGVNKGVILNHRNFIAAALMVTSDQEMKGDKHLIFLLFLPMFHGYGLLGVTNAQLQRGNAVVSMAKFDFVRMLEAAQEYKITNLPIVPPIMIGLAKQQNVVAKYDLLSLQQIIVGAAPVAKDIMEECFKRIPHVEIVQGYGLTESCGIATMTPPNETKGQFGSAGTLVPGMEAKVVNLETGKPLPPHQQGELWLRGANIMQGYLNNPHATRITLDKEGWLHTGDLVHFDEEGYLFIVDRIKELIKYKGFQVAPAELEALLLAHPEILDAGVIPLSDPEAGEVPIAYVVRSLGSSLTEHEVVEHVAKQVAPFKRLRRIFFVDSIPKSSSGKILRRELVQKVRSKL
eukprot:Gb_14620 [translate_table: standard]